MAAMIINLYVSDDDLRELRRVAFVVKLACGAIVGALGGIAVWNVVRLLGR